MNTDDTRSRLFGQKHCMQTSSPSVVPSCAIPWLTSGRPLLQRRCRWAGKRRWLRQTAACLWPWAGRVLCFPRGWLLFPVWALTVSALGWGSVGWRVSGGGGCWSWMKCLGSSRSQWSLKKQSTSYFMYFHGFWSPVVVEGDGSWLSVVDAAASHCVP